MSRIRDLRPGRGAHVEDVDDARPERRHLGDPHVEIEVGKRRGDAVQQADLVVGVNLDERVGHRLVDLDLDRGGRASRSARW